jgi:RNA polymerase sigma factor (sigma-70 family)
MPSIENEFLDLMEKHKGVIFKISRMYMDTVDDQNDLFQEITFQVWKAYPSFKGNRQFSTWMYRIALNTAITFLKAEKKRSFIQSDELEKFKIKQEDYNEQDEHNIKKMYKAIQLLNPIDKTLIFYYLEDISGKEIASQLGITEVNARVKMNRAKDKLK